MLATRNEITKYIPQRGSMVMIHDIIDITHDSAVTQFEILADNVFVKDGVLLEPGLLENIAQTAAAQMGYLQVKKGLLIPIGYIASIKSLKVFDLPPIGNLLSTSIQVINQVLNVIQIEGLVNFNGNVICRCEMNIFIER